MNFRDFDAQPVSSLLRSPESLSSAKIFNGPRMTRIDANFEGEDKIIKQKKA